jgi:CHAT domain-containing protein/tetratricopeptide (TPR) repeat protein
MTLVGCGPPETTEGRKIGGEIREALGDVRPIEPRLTLETGWAPCVTEPRTRSAGTGCSSADLLRTDLPVPRCSPPQTPETPGFQELTDIVRGQGGQARDPALVSLSLFLEADEASTRSTIRALEDFGDNPEALSDLSAAYLHLAGIADRPELLLASLESSSKAIELRPDPPALFNRALALSRLHLSTASQRAWETYLKAAPADAWATEAKESLSRSASGSYQQTWRAEVEPALRRAALGGDLRQMREIVSQHRQRSREWAERDLLSEWASSDGEQARAALRIAGGIGDTLAALGGDRMLAEGVKAISASGDGRRRERLRIGHRELAAGIDALYLRWRLEQASDHFRRAREHLSASPYALWVDFYLGLIAYYQGDYDRAAGLLEALEARIDRGRYPVLAGRVLWVRGLAAGSVNRLEATADLYLQALQIFCASGEEENVATVHALRGEVLNRLGRFEESWAHIYNALARSDRIFDQIRHHAVLQVAILNAHRQGLYHAGLAFADEHLRVARLTGSAQILHYSFMHHASLRYALGDLPGAKADLDKATHMKGLEDTSLQQRTKADFDLLSAEIAVETDPGGAVPLLDRTIREYERKGFTYLLPQAYGARARAFLRLGDLASAEQDLARQIRIYEGSAEEIQQDVFRLSLLDQMAPAFDTMIELQATKLGRPDLGLEYCERGRYRAFLDSWTKSSVGLTSQRRPMSWASFDAQRLRAGLPEGVAILEYSLLDGHLLAWVIQRSGIEMIVQNVKRPDLARRIRKLDRELARESSPVVSGEMYDLLVRPAVPLLDEITHLVIVPDKELFLVPFEALIDRQSGRYLLEDRTVSYAPSASLHVHIRETQARSRMRAPELVVAATGALNGGFEYSRLPQAPEESRSIAALYPQGVFLGNPSKEQFLAALSRAQVLHFSGHAMPNGEQPFASRLILADTLAEHVELYAYELYDQEFPHLELVVLSACGTAESSQPGLGMAATLAGPFLAAGVPQVIGSQWRVKDEPTRLFFATFHRHFAEGADAAAALQKTKLELLRSGDALLASPRVWGAFVLIGG